ncbi:MAG: DegT/DnrJ/EryC1/StrS family aminotransferase [Bacteroidales bacterium]|nr:DegT/DnrJ/EryC1/StrS family aminotransferase [Bacteroidales bacterium]
MKQYPFISLKKVNEPYEQELVAVAERVIRSGRYLHGEEVAGFERELSAYCGVGNVVSCSNGLDALRLIFKAYVSLGVMREGDEVVVPANTFIASVLAISDAGLVPVPAEPSAATHNLDLDLLERYITPRTRAVLAVHLYGSPCWSASFEEMAHRRGLKIVEDNAQAIGAYVDCGGARRMTGALGDAAAFSFYPTKNLGALGDAGAVATGDDALAARVRTLANYGSDVRYHNPFCGYNCRMDELQAAMLRVKLRHLDEITAERRSRASVYERAICNSLVRKPLALAGAVWHQYVVAVDNRQAFRDYLSAHGVGTDIHYPVPPHLQPCYVGLTQWPLPVAEKLANSVVSLPITESTPLSDFEEIAEIINSYKVDC